MPFAALTVNQFGHRYTLDGSPLGGLLLLLLVMMITSVLALRSIAPLLTKRDGLRCLGWSLAVCLWVIGHFYAGEVPVRLLTAEGHVYNVFRLALGTVMILLAVVTWLGIASMVALFLVMPPELIEQPLQVRVQSLWRRVYWLLPLLVVGWLNSYFSARVLGQIAELGFVPAIVLPVPTVVQVGHPFSVTPDEGHFVGAVYSHWFRPATTAVMGPLDFKKFRVAGQPFIAQKVGANEFDFQMVREEPIRLTVGKHFQLDAEVERGNPLFPLRVGDTWRYRAAVSETPAGIGEQFEQLLSGSPQPHHQGQRPPVEISISVVRAEIRGGVRVFEIAVRNPTAEREELRNKTYSASMWDGETYLGWQVAHRKPLLVRTHSEALTSHKVKGLFPCELAVLPEQRVCFCHASSLDEKRTLPGVAYCSHPRVITHVGENAFIVALGILTLGASAVGDHSLRMRDTEHFETGILLESSAGP
jgi:hypothetical protein